MLRIVTSDRSMQRSKGRRGRRRSLGCVRYSGVGLAGRVARPRAGCTGRVPQAQEAAPCGSKLPRGVNTTAPRRFGPVFCLSGFTLCDNPANNVGSAPKQVVLIGRAVPPAAFVQEA